MNRTIGALAAVASLAAFGASAAQQSAADAVFYNGKIITVDGGFSIRQAFAVKGDSFVAVGSNATVRKLAGKGAHLVDLHGAAVIPGLTDNHDHLFGTWRVLTEGVDLFGAKTTDEVLRRLAPAIAAAKPGETVVGTVGWEAKVTRADLDKASADHPIMLFRRRRGAALMNSAALAKAGITKDHPVFAGVKFPVDKAGEPTGEMSGEWPAGWLAQNAVYTAPPELEEKAILAGQKFANSEGLTSIRDSSNQASWINAYYRVWAKGELTVRVSAGLALTDQNDPIGELRQEAVGPGFGDHWLRIDSISEEPTPGDWPRERFIAFARQANRMGWKLDPHVGNMDIETMVQALEAVDRDQPLKGRRWIVEHISSITDAQAARLGKLGVIASIQSQAADRFAAYTKSEGEALAARETPTKSLMDAGVLPVSGSDSEPPTPETPGLNNPFIRLHFFVTRRAPGGKVMAPEQRVSRAEALKFATINSAYATFEEKLKGSIEPGKLADFVVLSGDYLTVPEDDILKLHPLATYVGGRLVYSTLTNPSRAP